MTVDGAPTEVHQQPRKAQVLARDEAVRRLRDLIRIEITDATSYVSGRVPVASEVHLMKRYRATRDTVRDALALLTDEGMIVRRRGVGTHPRTIQRPYPTSLPPLGQEFASYFGIGNIVPRLVRWAWVAAPPSVVLRLDGVEAGDQCLCIDYVLIHEGTPTATVTNYLRAAEGTQIRREAFTTDFYTLVDSGDGEIGSHDLTLQATIADAHVAALLDITAGDAVMWFEQIIRNTDGEAINFAVAHFRREVRVDLAGIPRVDIAGPRAESAM
ncbi:hypothetical protein B2J88_24475 [Rhodococcus sp. SRB_17]|nr:hypothetical protein [Rhodococcus sp. SRB_17]